MFAHIAAVPSAPAAIPVRAATEPVLVNEGCTFRGRTYGRGFPKVCLGECSPQGIPSAYPTIGVRGTPTGALAGVDLLPATASRNVSSGLRQPVGSVKGGHRRRRGTRSAWQGGDIDWVSGLRSHVRNERGM